MGSREDEWEALYEALIEAHGELGKNDAFGEGDYWLVDDDWGGLRHKIVVRNPDFWSDQVQQRIRETLKCFPQWGLRVVFDDHLAKLIEDNGGVTGWTLPSRIPLRKWCPSSRRYLSGANAKAGADLPFTSIASKWSPPRNPCIVRTSGSHHRLARPNDPGTATSVPVHSGKSSQRRHVARHHQAGGMTVDEFIALL